MTVAPVKQRVIALYVNLEREQARAMAAAVVDAIRSTGCAIAFCRGQGTVLAIDTDGAEVKDAELLVTIGGDGTLLRGARIAAPLGIPMLGINTGRMGFLTELDADEGPSRLHAMLEDGFAVEERVALRACANGGEWLFALNDVVVRRGSNTRMAPFGLALDGEMIAHIPSDGVIVATPTGSTGYFLSAGGPIISPGVEGFGIGALLPHTFFARPLIVPVTSTIEILCDSEIVHADLETDGQIVSQLEPGDRVMIMRYPQPLRFALSRPRAFFSRLQEKLQWGVPIKPSRA